MRIIGLAPNIWHGQWVNRQHLLSRLGLRHKVLYSTGAWSIWDRTSPLWRGASPVGRFQQADNVTIEEAPKYLLRWPRLPSFDQLVVHTHARRLRRFARDDQSPLLALMFHPSFFQYGCHLQADFLAYHAYDLFEATPGWDAPMEALELALLNKADLVTTASESIAARLRQKVAREIRVLPNGVDLGAFDAAKDVSAQVPEDLARIARPRLGYIGSLHPQVDYRLVAALAEARPSWNFVFVGPKVETRDARAEHELSLCRRHANVHFLGEKHRSEVPAYILNMDVNLMLYRLSDETWIKAIYPLKLHEYLAAGKPVVSADVPAVRDFTAVVRIAAGEADWLLAIEDALESGGRGTESQRRAVAASNTWEARVAHLDEWFTALAGRQRQK